MANKKVQSRFWGILTIAKFFTGITQLQDMSVVNKAQNMCKIFSLFPSKKPVIRENWDKLSKWLLFNFEW